MAGRVRRVLFLLLAVIVIVSFVGCRDDGLTDKAAITIADPNLETAIR